MNTLAYLQFFDGLVDQKRATFVIEHIPVNSIANESNQTGSYHCIFSKDHLRFEGEGNSRKEALKELYRKVCRYKKL